MRYVHSARAVKVLLHLLRRVGAREVFAQPVAGDGDAVYLRILLLGHDRPHDSGSQLSALGELLEPLQGGVNAIFLLSTTS